MARKKKAAVAFEGKESPEEEALEHKVLKRGAKRGAKRKAKRKMR